MKKSKKMKMDDLIQKILNESSESLAQIISYKDLMKLQEKGGKICKRFT